MLHRHEHTNISGIWIGNLEKTTEIRSSACGKYIPFGDMEWYSYHDCEFACFLFTDVHITH